MAFTQENRSVLIDTPLGKDALLLSGFSGTEALSDPFTFELDLQSENNSIVFKDIVGQNVTVTLLLPRGRRFFNGIISRFSQGRGGNEAGGDARFTYYTATMVPWLWLLTQTADSRIFQKLSIPDIVEQIFTEKGFSDYEMRLSESYEKKDYCVQYRETDFNFVSRLIEQEGIFYFFSHEKNKHTLIIADSPAEHAPCPKQKTAQYQSSAGGWLDKDVITGLEWSQEIRIGKYTVNDFNFEMPSTDLKVEVPSQHALGPGEREVYDYPAEYAKRAEGDRLGNLRMQEEEVQITSVTGSSVCRAFNSGYRFDLLGYYRNDMNKKSYVLESVNHVATEPVGASGQEGEASYTNSFTCFPFDVPYRPPRITPKPIVEGTQTAIITGPAGEEIYTDEHGRVKVQFHWDREGKRDENSSCWIRVSQAWAGAGWGAMYIPRIGHEVIVDFMEGDPDRPIITGRVYHGNNKPPYSLPAEKTKSTIKSDSSLGGGGSNEFRFEDKKGEEEVFLHGQKDWTIAIENDKNQTVGHDETLDVGNDRTKSVGNNQSESIGKDKSISVGDNHTESIGKNASVDIGKDKTVSVGENATLSVGKNQSEDIGKNSDNNVGENATLNVGKNYTGAVGEKASISVGKDANVQIDGNFSISGKKKAVIDIKDELTFKCGKASIILKKNGDIQIKGNKLNFKASGDLIMKGSKITSN